MDAAGLIVPLARRLPPGPRPHGAQLVGRLIWEGVVYGTAEAILLATPSVLAVWQATDALGWTGADRGRRCFGGARGGRGVVRDPRKPPRIPRVPAEGRQKTLGGALVACGVQALAFLLTGSIIAPVLAHILLHCQLTLRGNEMP